MEHSCTILFLSQRIKLENKVVGNSNVTPNQKFELENNVTEKDFQVSINNIFYSPVESFVKTKATDYVYRFTKNEDNKCILEFGDGTNGAIPPNNLVIANYYITNGTSGNLNTNQITEIKSTISVPSGFILKCTNLKKSAGGTDSETLEDLKMRVPIHLRTLQRAVTENDYIELAQLIPSVSKAGIVYKGDKKVYVYVVPKGGGLASNSLLNEVVLFFEDKKMITTTVEAYPAGEIKLQLNITIRLLSIYSRTQKETEIKQTLLDLFATEKQKIKGSVYLSDITQSIENIVGVSNSDIVEMQAIPYPLPIAPNNKMLDGTITPINAIIVTKFKILVQSSINYQLFKNDVFVGNYTFGVLVNTTECSFKINNNGYSIGDTWEFIMYPKNKNIILEEASIPALYENDIVLNLIGGVV